MADQAHSTPAPKIIASGGPVSVAITAGRGERDPIAAIREGLDRHFADVNRQRIRELRRAISDRIEADIALLDALDPFADEREGEQTIEMLDTQGRLYRIGLSADDNGIADDEGQREQFAGTRYAYQGAI